jgi:16S rRNA (cytosine967-C5)-methyltransferase
VLVRVDRDRAYADLALHAELRDTDLERRDRALATELAYGALRCRGRLDAALAQVLDRPLDRVEPDVLNLLRLGAYQVLELDRVPVEAAVSETVSLAKAVGLGRSAGFVNAVLRSLVDRRGAFVSPDPETDPVGWLVERGSLPEWMAERWLDQLGQKDAIALAESCLEPPPRTVRVSARADLEAVHARLGGRRTRFAPRGLTELAKDPLRDAGFERGEFTVQDEASQLVPLLLGAKDGDTVVDCCAAPGGKAAQIAEIVGPHGEVIALDSNAARLGLVRKNAERLRLQNVRPLERDVTQGLDLRGPQAFRFVLVDAPCTGLGVLRRNPDARWRVEPEDVYRSAALQLRILDSVARYVEPGGALVYSVCTMTPEETTDVVASLLEAHTDFALDDPRAFLPLAAAELVGDDLALRTLPHLHGCDGFFAVRMTRA